MGDVVYDVELLDRLNEEYKVEEKTQVANPPRYDPESRQKRAQEAARNLDALIGLKGQRILEIGCGLGDLALELATNYDAEVVGVDVRPQESWKEMNHPRLTLKEYDLTTTGKGAFPADSFTRIMSQAVWEHIRHPYTALAECQRILHPAGKKYLFANLHRSAIASHLYRLIHFPWPHLLFSPETIASGSFWKVKEIDWAFWVNKLTYAQYTVLPAFRKKAWLVSPVRSRTGLFRGHPGIRSRVS